MTNTTSNELNGILVILIPFYILVLFFIMWIIGRVFNINFLRNILPYVYAVIVGFIRARPIISIAFAIMYAVCFFSLFIWFGCQDGKCANSDSGIIAATDFCIIIVSSFILFLISRIQPVLPALPNIVRMYNNRKNIAYGVITFITLLTIIGFSAGCNTGQCNFSSGYRLSIVVIIFAIILAFLGAIYYNFSDQIKGILLGQDPVAAAAIALADPLNVAAAAAAAANAAFGIADPIAAAAIRKKAQAEFNQNIAAQATKKANASRSVNVFTRVIIPLIVIIFFLIFIFFYLVLRIPLPFVNPNNSTSNENSSYYLAGAQDVFVILFVVLILAIIIFTSFSGSVPLISNLNAQIYNVKYIVLYILALIILFSFTPDDIINNYANIILPISIFFAILFFYLSSSQKVSKNFNFNFERIRSVILLFCLSVILIIYKVVDPGNYISEYFGYSANITIAISVLSFIFLLILFWFKNDAAAPARANSFNFLNNFSSITSYGSILFLIFIVTVIILMATYGKTIDKGVFGASIMIIVLLSILWGALLLIVQFPEMYNRAFTINYGNFAANPAANRGQWVSFLVNFFTRILLVIFSIVIFSLIVFWINNYINNFTGNTTTSIISLVLNAILLLIVFFFIYKNIVVTKNAVGPGGATPAPSIFTFTNLLKTLSSVTPLLTGLITMLSVLLFSILFKIPNPFNSSSNGTGNPTTDQIEKDVVVILSFVTIIFLICYFILPSFKDVRKLFSQIGGVSYTIIYTIFLILFFHFMPADIIDKYAYIITPVSIALAIILFYISYSKNLIGNFNFTYERAKIMILFFCLITMFAIYYTIDPGGYIQKYFGYSLFITILLSVFAFIYLLIVLTLPSTIPDTGTKSSNFFANFTSTSTIGSIAFIIFIIIVTIGICIYKTPADNSSNCTIDAEITSVTNQTNTPTTTKASYSCSISGSQAKYTSSFVITTPANQLPTLPYNKNNSTYNDSLYITPLNLTTATNSFNYYFGNNNSFYCPNGGTPSGQIKYQTDPTLNQKTQNSTTTTCDNGCLTKSVPITQPVQGDITSTIYYRTNSSPTGWSSYNVITPAGEKVSIPVVCSNFQVQDASTCYYGPEDSTNPTSAVIQIIDPSGNQNTGYAEIPPTLEIVYQEQTTGCSDPKTDAIGLLNGNKKISMIVITLVLVICLLWAIVLGSTQFPEVFQNQKIGDKLNFFKRSLLALFGIVISGLLIFWIVYNIQHFSGDSQTSIISLVLNTILVIIVLALIYKTINVQLPVGNSNKNAFFSLMLNTIFYIPCYFSNVSTNVSSSLPSVGTPQMASLSSVIMLILVILLIFLYFKAPYLINKFILQGGKQLVNEPVNTNTQYPLGTYQELSGTDNFEYEYAISFWFYLEALPPNTNAAYDKYTSLLNFGEKPNVLYCGKTNTLMITMQQKDLQKSTNNKLIDFDENGHRILYIKHDVLLQKWNNLVINYSGGILDIFINNELVKSDIGVVPYYTLDNLTIGENNGINGGISNLIYFNHPLNTTNMYILYNYFKNKDPPSISSTPKTILEQNINTATTSAQKVQAQNKLYLPDIPDIANI